MIYLHVMFICGASLVAQTVKNLPTMRETQVRSLGRSWKREWQLTPQRNLVGYSPMGLQRVRYDCVTNTFTYVYYLFLLSL